MVSRERVEQKVREGALVKEERMREGRCTAGDYYGPINRYTFVA
jgi:hypothetical protein